MPERIYLDASPVIYAIEHVDFYAPAVDKRLSTPDTILVASDLTRLECRVKPMQDNNSDLLADYDLFFEKVVSHAVALSKEVIDRATEIRARFGFKAPDAIHLAAALESECDVFLTNDRGQERFIDIAVETVESPDTTSASRQV